MDGEKPPMSQVEELKKASTGVGLGAILEVVGVPFVTGLGALRGRVWGSCCSRVI